jgi:hypothetical protein
MMMPDYNVEDEGPTIPPREHSHIDLYDVVTVCAYRIEAKKRNDMAMTARIKYMLHIHMKPFRFIRVQLFRHFPDYLKG